MKTKAEYLKDLEGGHAIISEEYAKEVCEAFNVPFSKKLSKKQYDSHHGVFYNSGEMEEGLKGVWDLDLLYYIAKKLGVETQNNFHGYGFQAEFIADEIRKAIKE